MNCPVTCTDFTFDATAPFKPAIAVKFLDNFIRYVTQITTQKIAAIDCFTRSIAESSTSSEWAGFCTLFAKIRRFGCVHQVQSCWRFDCSPFHKKFISFVTYHHFGCAIKFWFEKIAHFAKCWQLLPTGLLTALSRYSMAFTFLLNVRFHRLKQNKTMHVTGQIFRGI